MKYINEKSTQYLFSILILLAVIFANQACNVSTDASDTILYDKTGILTWGGFPSTDGTGILLETADTTYGAPGNREDYSEYFPEGENRIQVIADIKITGESTIRGWGTQFPEIEILKISKVDQTQ